MRWALVLSVLTACSSKPVPPDIVGPFTGTTYRFVASAFELPTQRSDFADDLNCDDRADDQLGNVVGLLTAQQINAFDAIDDMLASGALEPVVEITTDDPLLQNDPTVGVRIRGHDGEDGGEMGASLVAGVLVTNRTRYTTHPASATVHVPLFEHVDAIAFDAIGIELETMGAIPNGAEGGFAVIVHGGLAGDYRMRAWQSLARMLETQPDGFSALRGSLDTNHDGAVSFDEFLDNALVANVSSPDVQLTDGEGHFDVSAANRHRDALSFGFRIRLKRCDAGICQDQPTDPCDDRVVDGDETDVDCGGSCSFRCAGGQHCGSGGDCLSSICVAGTCTAPSCSDGVRNGLEGDVDCGYGCAVCALGRMCWRDIDCASRYCDGSVCAEPLCSDGVMDTHETDVDCGGPCSPCADGKGCHDDADCASGHCAYYLSGDRTCAR